MGFFSRRLDQWAERMRPQQLQTAARRVQSPSSPTPGLLLRQCGRLWDALSESSAAVGDGLARAALQDELRRLGRTLYALDENDPEQLLPPEVVAQWESLRSRVVEHCERARSF